jgi:O-antigen/teichoic acid export membrane protein
MNNIRGIKIRVGRSLKGPTARTTISNVTILATNALAGVVSARALGPAGRGQLAIVVLWSALVQMLGNLGIPSSFAYYMARWPERRVSVTRWLMRVAALQAIAMTAASTGVLWWLHVRLAIPVWLTVEYIAWAAAASITLYGACHAQGIRDFARFNFLRTAPNIATSILLFGIAILVHLTPTEAGATYLIPTVGTSIIAAVWLRRATGDRATNRLSRHERHAIWSYGWRSLASFSGLALNRNADQIVLGLVVPVSSLGLYTAASAASSPLPSLVSSLGIVGLPRVTALTGKEKSDATWRITRRGVYSLVLISPVLAALLPWAIPFVYGPRYASAVLPGECLLAGTVFAALATITDDLLRAHGHPGFVSITQGVGGIVTIVGAVLLGGHPLSAVAIVSSLGFFAALVLALVRLAVATRRQASEALSGPTPRPPVRGQAPARHVSSAPTPRRLIGQEWRLYLVPGSGKHRN